MRMFHIYKGESEKRKLSKQERLMERNQKLYELGLRINQTLNLNERLRLPSRLRLFRRFCARHPKKVFGICYALMIPFVVLTFCVEWGSAEQEKSVLDAPNVVSSMRAVESRNSQVREESRQLFEKASQLKHEIDSLMSIKELSHEDSVLLASKLRQLDAIISK